MLSPRVVLFLLAFFSTSRHVLGSWHRDFTTETSSNVRVTAKQDFIHFECDGSLEDDKKARAFLSPVPATGATASFYVDVRLISGLEVKFNLFDDVTLRWRQGEAKWEFYDRRVRKFLYLGASNIYPNKGKHSVTYVRGRESFAVFEDGKLVATHKNSRTMVTPAFTVTVWKKGGKVDMTLSKIQIHYGVSSETALIT